MRQTKIDIPRSKLEFLIDEYVIGKNAERDRAIMRRRLIDGICFEPLAEEFDLSVRRVKDIVYKCNDKIFKHIV
jgi:hypothetical protein